jgi:membrane protein
MKLKAMRDVSEETIAKWSADDAQEMAAALAYYAVFSIAPLLMIAIAVAGLVFGQSTAQGEIMNQLQGLLGPQGARAVETMLRNANHLGSGLVATIVGVVSLLLGASGVMGQLQSSMNRMWKVQPVPRAAVVGYVRQRMLSFTMVLGVGFLLLVSLVASAALAAIGKYMGERLPFGETVLEVLNLSVSFAVITFLFMLIFRYVPETRVPWRDVWHGAAFTAVLFSLGKFAIGLYLGKSSIASSYGAAGSLVILLVWVYYSAQILFLGAELTYVIATRAAAAAEESDSLAGAPERRRQERRGKSDRRRPMPASVPVPAR